MAAGLQAISWIGSFSDRHDIGRIIAGSRSNRTGVEWLGDTVYAIDGNEERIDDSVMVVDCENGFSTTSSHAESSACFSMVEKNRSVEKRMNNAVLPIKQFAIPRLRRIGN